MAGQGNVQADVVLEKELSVPHLDLLATEGVWHIEYSLNKGDIKVLPHSDTSSNQIIPPNSATLYRPTIQTCESIGAIPIQTTTPGIIARITYQRGLL